MASHVTISPWSSSSLRFACHRHGFPVFVAFLIQNHFQSLQLLLQEVKEELKEEKEQEQTLPNRSDSEPPCTSGLNLEAGVTSPESLQISRQGRGGPSVFTTSVSQKLDPASSLPQVLVTPATKILKHEQFIQYKPSKQTKTVPISKEHSWGLLSNGYLRSCALQCPSLTCKP